MQRAEVVEGLLRVHHHPAAADRMMTLHSGRQDTSKMFDTSGTCTTHLTHEEAVLFTSCTCQLRTLCQDLHPYDVHLFWGDVRERVQKQVGLLGRARVSCDGTLRRSWPTPRGETGDMYRSEQCTGTRTG